MNPDHAEPQIVTARRPGRPPIVVFAIVVAALAGLPAAAAVPVVPQPSAARADAGPRAPGPAGVESMRFNPVAFRIAGGAPLPSAGPVAAQPLITTLAAPGTAAARAIEFALAQRGLPYVWGGNGPQQGDAGFDCSGLTTAAYAYAGITLPRTAHTQYYAGPHVPDGAPLEPGDLVFYGVPQRVHHVGLYLGEGRMVNAPTFGKPVRVAYVRYPGDDYLGATRPAAGVDAPAGGLLATPDLPVEVPPVPSPLVPAAPEEFAAPEVPAAELPLPPAAPLLAAPQLPQTGGTALVEEAPAGPGTGGTPGDDPAPGPAPSTVPTPSPAVTPTAPTPTPPAPTPPAPTPPAPTPPAPPSTTPPPTTTPPPASAEAAPAEPAPARPVALTLPGGVDLNLAAAERGPDGLPVAPASTSRGALRWSPAEDDRAARATVALHPDTAVAALTPGGTVTLRGEDGTTTTLTIRSRVTLDAAAAADRAAGRGESLRLVLLRTDPATGEVLVVIAE